METKQERYLRFEKAKAEAKKNLSRLQDLYKYFLPSKRFDDAIEKSELSSSNDLKDATGAIAAYDFANNFHSIMLPPFRNWAMLRPLGMVNITKKIEEVFFNATNLVFQIIHSSNFNLAIHEALLDFAIGTGIILINELDEDDPRIIDVKSISANSVYYEEGGDGSLDNFWVEHRLTGEQVIYKWPSSKLTSEEAKQEEKLQLSEGVIYYKNNGIKKGKVQCDYYHYVQNLETQREIFYEWLEYNPFIGFRYSKVAGKNIGIGLADLALGHVKILNDIMSMEMKGLGFKSNLPYLYDPLQFKATPAVIRPGAFIGVTFQGNTPPIMPFPAPSEARSTFISIANLQQSVREIFITRGLDDVLRTPGMSATEVAVRQQEFIRKIGSSISRFTSELIRPFILTCVKIMKKKGLLADLTALEVKNEHVKVEYTSPIAALQEQQDAAADIQTLETILRFFGEKGLESINIDKTTRILVEKLRADPSILKDESEVEAIAQQKGALLKEKYNRDVESQERLVRAKEKQTGVKEGEYEIDIGA